MTDIKVLNDIFEEKGAGQVNLDLSAERINVPVVHQVVKATLASRRQGNACTKNRALVQGGGAKPFKQKGTGRARQGSSRSPLLVGGGTVFGPSPRSYEQKVNKKIMLKAIQAVLADKHQAGKLFVIDEIKSDGKTKGMFQKLSNRGLLPGLVVTEKSDNLAIRACRNLEKGKAMAVEGFSVYEALKYENLIIEKGALDILARRLEQ